ncbi:amidase [Plastoroseomonas arctica]|uniref:Amidase n=1 Tax=Plastoroseomonas arctica TaxID=1509237 RepID=A0AAF1JXA1_9PROT|nr:amidase [Plastoroseomonas arctica]MBR0653724.1 amidase [Plastoroseomonas arctica]
MTHPADLSLAELRQRVEAGSLSALDLAEAYLERIAAREPVLRAFAWLDPALVRREAAAIDRSSSKGLLFGVPFAVKDVIDTADQPSQYGSPIWAGWRPRSDAACVAAARLAGANIIGKTVTTEFATRHAGATTNPANPRHTPGGSSQGSAAAVGAGVVPLAFGTQTAGSVIRPAAFCGAVGFKPSYGTLHRAGMKVMSESLDTIGIMARSVVDAAYGMAALTGRSPGDVTAKPARAPRLAVVMGPQADLAAPETIALFERVAEACRRAGATVTPVTLTPPMGEAFEAHPFVMNMESAASIAWEMDHARALVSPVLAERMEWARAQDPQKLEGGRAAFAAARAAFPAMIEGFDAVLTPAAPGEAPEGLGWTGDPGFNTLWTLLHVPCVTVPAGSGPRGLPLGVQVVGRIGEDGATLAWGEWVARAIG